MLAHLATSSRLVTANTVPRTTALAVVRQASSGGHKKADDSVAESSPMSQRPLPPDDGKVRKYPMVTDDSSLICSIFEGFANPWDIILNKRRFEYAMVKMNRKKLNSSLIRCFVLEIQRIR